MSTIYLYKKIEIVSPDIKHSVILDKEAETILIVRLTLSDLHPLITCKIVLTSPTVRTDTDTDDSDLYLNKQRCLVSLAELRQAKWFQARASQITNGVIIMRIIRDLCSRNPSWEPLSQWALELLVEKSLSSCSQQMQSSAECLRRVLECVSSGVILPDGPGLYDPCEKDPTDAAENLTDQQREDLTASAHMALRLMAFKQIHKILGIESLSQQYHTNNKLAKKRQIEKDTENENVKKEKLEEKTEATTITDEVTNIDT